MIKACRMCYNARIEVEKWDDKIGWHKIGEYEPNYCPNCGRKIIEYNKNGLYV